MGLIFRFKDDNGVAQTLIQNPYLLLIGGNDDGSIDTAKRKKH